MSNIIPCLIICFIFTMPSLTHGKDVCDPNLKYDKKSITAYLQRSLEKPCEGFYISKVSASSLEIVGLSLGRLSFDASQIRQLTISSPIIKNQQIKVRAVGIPLKMYYRMDAELASGKSMTWPLEDVLTKKKVMGEDIGLFGWLAERPEIYVPLAVGNPKNEAIILSLRAAVDISEASWRYSALENNKCSRMNRKDWQEIPAKRGFRSGQPIDIKLPVNPELLCVEVAAKPKMHTGVLKKLIRVQTGD